MRLERFRVESMPFIDDRHVQTQAYTVLRP